MSRRIVTAPAVSVVVPTHNRAHLLPRLLGSLFAQDFDDFEVVVVDDGSVDATPQVLAEHTRPQLHVVRRPTGGGVSHARNAGTAAARGKWVAWCDDDDVWDPAKLRLQLEALEQMPEARWCNAGAAYVDNDLHLLRTMNAPPPGDLSREMIKRNRITGGGSGVLADRQLALSVGGFDPAHSIFADWHMWARLALESPIASVDLPLVGYVVHGEGMSHHRQRLLREFDDLRRDLAELARHPEDVAEMDVRWFGVWMQRQQVGAGRRLDSFLLPYQLLRRNMMSPLRAVPHSVVGPLMPQLVRRRWRRQWEGASEKRHVVYAEQWLAQARRTLPPVVEPVSA